MNQQDYTVLDGFFERENLTASRFLFKEDDFGDKLRMGDPVFKSIGYPSKIYYKNIEKYILSYTKPGGVVLDSCAGSGSTGIAALLTGRKAVLMDASPLAVNMEYNLVNYVDLKLLEKEYRDLVRKLESEINNIYYTGTSDGRDGYAEVIIASNVYACPACGKEIVLYKNGTGKRSEYRCIQCGKVINIAVQEIKDLQVDKRRPVEVTVIPFDGSKKEVKAVTEQDTEKWRLKLQEYNRKYGSLWSPKEHIVYNRAYPRVGGWPGFPIDATVSDLFPERNLISLKILNHYIENEIANHNVKNFMKFIFLETLFRTSSRLFTGSGIKNVYHIPPVGKEQNVMTVFKRKYKAITKAKDFLQSQLKKEQTENCIRIIKCDAKKNPVPDNVVDYAFIDPPYGGMVPYAELNLFYSAWLHEKEDLEHEIMIPMDYEKKEGYVELWGSYIQEAFGEVFRVLKPGACFTVAFHSKFSNIWNELKDIMQVRLGFEFVNIVENERSTTFHINHINDTNPVSAFITYRKPEDGQPHKTMAREKRSVFDIFDKQYLKKGKTFRAVQSRIIKLVNECDLAEVPDDSAIQEWLENICSKSGDNYILE